MKNKTKYLIKTSVVNWFLMCGGRSRIDKLFTNDPKTRVDCSQPSHETITHKFCRQIE